jgi:osmotically-inducible protein OsmY
VRAINVNIETYHGSVYLMGLARTDAELRRAAEIASYVPGVQRVVSFMRTSQPDAYLAATPEPTPGFAQSAY